MTRRKRRLEIFKVQLPLESTAENPPALVYNRNRTIENTITITGEVLKLFPKGVHKVYVYGYVDNVGILQVQGKASNQNW